ncbi:SDR family NAD(P)-dependent oxidoreductase [Streptomyces phaeochromogenes]
MVAVDTSAGRQGRRSVVVTGATGGVGAATALRLAGGGFDVIGTARSQPPATPAATRGKRPLKIKFQVLDVGEAHSGAAGVARARRRGRARRRAEQAARPVCPSSEIGPEPTPCRFASGTEFHRVSGLIPRSAATWGSIPRSCATGSGRPARTGRGVDSPTPALIEWRGRV